MDCRDHQEEAQAPQCRGARDRPHEIGWTIGAQFSERRRWGRDECAAVQRGSQSAQDSQALGALLASHFVGADAFAQHLSHDFRSRVTEKGLFQGRLSTALSCERA